MLRRRDLGAMREGRELDQRRKLPAGLREKLGGLACRQCERARTREQRIVVADAIAGGRDEIQKRASGQGGGADERSEPGHACAADDQL